MFLGSKKCTSQKDSRRDIKKLPKISSVDIQKELNEAMYPSLLSNLVNYMAGNPFSMVNYG